MIDGVGISLNVFFQGCKIRCPGCHNPELQDPEGGNWLDTDEIISHLKKYEGFYQSIVFLGGEATEQEEALLDLASKSRLKHVLYTGKRYEDLSICIRGSMDMIVDGPYIEGLKTSGFPASSNQRVYSIK